MFVRSILTVTWCLCASAVLAQQPIKEQPSYVVVISDGSVHETKKYLMVAVVNASSIDALRSDEEVRHEYSIDRNLPKIVDRFRRLLQGGNPRSLTIAGHWHYPTTKAAAAAKSRALQDVLGKQPSEDWLSVTDAESKALHKALEVIHTADAKEHKMQRKEYFEVGEIQIAARFLETVVGTPGPITVDMGVHRHNQYRNQMTDDEIADADLVTIGKADEPLTIGVIRQAFEAYENREMVQNQLNSGRSYFYEGMTKDGDRWEVDWGS